MGLFTGERISLRALEPDDIKVLYQWENNPDIWWLGNTLKPYSHDTLRKYLEIAHLDIYESQQVRFAIVKNDNPDTPVGLIDLYNFDPHHQRAGVGILLGRPEDRGKGYAREALGILCLYAFKIVLINQLFCSIPENNPRSIHLFEKAGFKKTGERPEWIRTSEGWITDYFFQLSSKDWATNAE